MVAVPVEIPVTRPEGLTLAMPDALEVKADGGAPGIANPF